MKNTSKKDFASTITSNLPGNLVTGKASAQGKLTLDQKLELQGALTKLVFLSMFAGCGGSSWGYKSAGMIERLAVEWDKHARSVFKLNFPDIPVENLDISKTEWEGIAFLS